MILLFIKVIFKMLFYEHDWTIHFILFFNTSCQSIYAVSAKIKKKKNQQNYNIPRYLNYTLNILNSFKFHKSYSSISILTFQSLNMKRFIKKKKHTLLMEV